MEVLFVFSSVLTTTTIAFVNKPVIYLPATESLAFYVTGPSVLQVCRNTPLFNLITPLTSLSGLVSKGLHS